MMKEMYINYKNELKKRNSILLLIIILFIIGIIFGSIYITILNNDQKLNVLKKVGEYYKSFNKMTFDGKIDIFKNSLYSNFIYIISIWILGISVIGLPIIFIMTFFKSFIFGFSISSIFAKYKLKGLLKVFLYLFPCNIILILYVILLACYSVSVSIKVFKGAIFKQNINFKTFMGKYFLLLLIGILISVLSSLYFAFIEPMFY